MKRLILFLTVLIIGVSDKKWGTTTLPWSLTPLGAKGCTVYCSLDVLLGINTNSTGNHTQTFAIPNLTGAVGAQFFMQYAIADNANTFGTVLSNAGKGKLGKP